MGDLASFSRADSTEEAVVVLVAREVLVAVETVAVTDVVTVDDRDASVVFAVVVVVDVLREAEVVVTSETSTIIEGHTV